MAEQDAAGSILRRRAIRCDAVDGDARASDPGDDRRFLQALGQPRQLREAYEAGR